MNRLGRMRGVLAICALVVLAATAFSSAAARPVDRPGGERAGTQDGTAQAAAAPGNEYGIPTFVPIPDASKGNMNKVAVPYGGTVKSATAQAARSKVSLSVDNAVLLNYQLSCLAFPFGPGQAIQTCCPDPVDVATCPRADRVDNPATSADDQSTANWTLLKGPVWVASPGSRRFGTFPSTTVNLLAFGSIPASATVSLTQPTAANGLVEPLDFSWLNLGGNFPEGTTVAGFPTGRPPLPVGAPTNFQYDQRLVLKGRVEVRLSNVKIDGVPVDVGPACATKEPATLSYSGPRGWWDSDAQAVLRLEGRPGGYRPVGSSGATGDNTNLTGSATGNISIPAFRGCRDGARSLDPLVTALASGPRNSLKIVQDGPLNDCGSGRVVCPDFPTEQSVPTPQAASAGGHARSTVAPQRSSGRGWLRLSDADRARAVKSLAGLPASRRSAVLRTMPLVIVRAVQKAVR